MKRSALTVVLLVMGAMLPPPAQAAPAAASHERPTLADLDGDRISDALARRMDRLPADELIEVVVTWTEAPDVDRARRAAGRFRVLREFDIIDGFSAQVTAAQARSLARLPGVFRVEENFEVSVTIDAADLDYGTAQARADFGVSGSGVNACIVDTGADPAHEQLDNGKIVGFHDEINGQANAYDDHGHGTHVASILAGDGSGSSPDAATYGGVAPGADLYIAKALSAAGSGTEAQIIGAIDWCAAQPGVRIISMSLGTSAQSDGQDGLSQAVNNAVLDKGMVVVVAAGNSGDGPSVGSPGAAAEALTIGASTTWSDGTGGPYLAPFSSRGPTLDGRLKPDVVAPGVNIVAAEANTGTGYVAFSGTSMATPFAAGTVALALQRDSSLTPAGVKALLTSTARDLGVDGHDNDWGAGLLDGYEVVQTAGGDSGGTGMVLPTHAHLTGSVADNGLWTHTFTVDDTSVPIVATILADGSLQCSFFWIICWIWEWSPDLDGRMIGPDGTVLQVSECALNGDCGAVPTGRQETFHYQPTITGEYRIEIYPFADNPNNGQGGTFTMDLFHGPVGAAPPPPPPPPPPPANSDPVAVDDAFATDEDVTLVEPAPGVLGNDSDPDGDPLTAALATQAANGTATVDPDGSFTYQPAPDFNGTDSFTYTVSDDQGGSATGTVTVTVVSVNDPPVADAGPDQTITADASGSAQVTLDGTGSTDVEGPIESYTWTAGGSTLATGATPTVSLAEGVHTITLTVTDGDASSSDDQVVITVEAAPSTPTVHVGDLDGTSTSLGRGRWNATVTVRVDDGAHAGLAGATVTLSVSDGSTKSCATGAGGTCQVTSNTTRNRVGSLTFTVVSVVAAGHTYQVEANHDPDGDSTGTVLTVAKP